MFCGVRTLHGTGKVSGKPALRNAGWVFRVEITEEGARWAELIGELSPEDVMGRERDRRGPEALGLPLKCR